jgi:tetratricopeptide (TPR) repeat protein
MLLSVLVVTGLILAALVPAMGQTRSVRGKVVDDKGNPIEGVSINLIGLDTVRTIPTKTNRRGEYTVLLGIHAATFRVVARKEGYGPEYRDNIRPDLTEASEVNFTLTPGPDRKLPFEYTDQDLADMQKRQEDLKRREKFAKELDEALKLGVAHYEEGNYTGAIEEFNKALEKLPEEPVLHANLANAYARSGQKDLALASFEKAIQLNPMEPDFYSDMGLLLIGDGRIDDAEKAFEKAAALDPVGAARNFFNLGASMVNSGRMEEATMAFRQAVTSDPNYTEAYYQLGLSLSGNADTIPEAIEMLRKYISMGGNPEQVEVAKAIIEALGG